MKARGQFISFHLDGVDQLDAMLARLPDAFAKGVLTRAAKKAMKIVEAEANLRSGTEVGKVTGAFEGSFQTSTVLSKSQRRKAGSARSGEVRVYTGSVDPKAHLLEFGWEFAPPHPILRPAWEQNKERVLEIFAEECGKELMKSVRRLRNSAMKGTLSKRATIQLAGT